MEGARISIASAVPLERYENGYLYAGPVAPMNVERPEVGVEFHYDGWECGPVLFAMSPRRARQLAQELLEAIDRIEIEQSNALIRLPVVEVNGGGRAS